MWLGIPLLRTEVGSRSRKKADERVLEPPLTQAEAVRWLQPLTSPFQELFLFVGANS